MNAFVAKDGSRHTNRDTMKRADARFGANQQQPSAQGDGDPGDDGMQDGDPNDGAAMAEQHGPAIEINVKHDHEGGSHRVHAVHPDGHQHETEHGTAAEAHQYASDVAGVGGDTGGDGGASGGMGGM